MKYLILLLLLFFYMSASHANDASIPLNDFAALPVQHEGRIKPLDSLARSELRYISNQENFGNQPAVRWLADVMFTPQTAIQYPLFRIDNVVLKRQLLLPERKNKAYSLVELLPSIQQQSPHIAELVQKAGKIQRPEERALLQLADQIARYINLLGSANLFYPMTVLDGSTQSYLDVLISQPDLEQKLKSLVRKKGQNLHNFNASEILDLKLGMRMSQIRESADQTDTMRIIPPRYAEQKNWLSPWSAVSQTPQLEYQRKFLIAWQNLASAYRINDSVAFQSEVIKIHQLNASSAAGALSEWRIKLEIIYHQYQPFQIAAFVYLIVVVTLLFPSASALKHLRVLSPLLGISALLLHSAALVMRVLILMRAPVGTLHETILFVTLVTAIFSITQVADRKQHIFAIIGLVFSGVMLLTAPMISTGDSLDLLVAVLNTNFWLSTHVICITMAYAFCAIVSVIANVILWREGCRIQYPANTKPLLDRMLMAALFLTTLGTVLGGIWADQSWGRFWGWDPKENGALMIILWLSWALHGRINAKLSRLHFLAALAWLSVVVALSWFGVNMLGAGLHSYGFISGIAVLLASFCIAQTVFIFYALGRVRAKRHAA